MFFCSSMRACSSCCTKSAYSVSCTLSSRISRRYCSAMSGTSSKLGKRSPSASVLLPAAAPASDRSGWRAATRSSYCRRSAASSWFLSRTSGAAGNARWRKRSSSTCVARMRPCSSAASPIAPWVWASICTARCWRWKSRIASSAFLRSWLQREICDSTNCRVWPARPEFTS